MPAVAPAVVERFRSKIHVRPETGCWMWTGWKLPKGYGVFDLPGGKKITAHRFAYEHLGPGPIPAGLVIDHFLLNRDETRAICSRACVNPDHLEPKTTRDNIRSSDAWRKWRFAGRTLPEGVSPKRRRFRARITVNGRQHELGLYRTPAEAHAAFLAARERRDRGEAPRHRKE